VDITSINFTIEYEFSATDPYAFVVNYAIAY
jgi:hypothetical protein